MRHSSPKQSQRPSWLFRASQWLVIIPLLSITSSILIHAMFYIPLSLATNHAVFITALGLGIGLIGCAFISPLLRIYVIGHELSHWLVAMCFRRRTARLQLQRDAGSIDIERPNIWIVLAPYYIPFYTCLWLIVVAIAQIWVSGPLLIQVLYLGLGLTYAFHLVFTVSAMAQGQPDLRVYGPVLSLVLIVMMNSLLLYGGLIVLNGDHRQGITYITRAATQQWGMVTNGYHDLMK